MQNRTIPRRRLRPKLVGQDTCYYHLVSRIVDRRFVFGDIERRYFYDLMRVYESFGRLRVVGYCLMSNHFHILVRAVARPDERLSEEALLTHVSRTLGQEIADSHRKELALLRKSLADTLAAEASFQEKLPSTQASTDVGREPGADSNLTHTGSRTPSVHWQEKAIEDYLAAIWLRMYDVASFVQSIKRRFSVWYNKKQERTGTLWEERYRSTLVQGGAAVTEIAAYIDLNPVRAGLVDDPKDYPWSQYGAAMAGKTEERAAVATIMDFYANLTDAEASTWDATQGRYRVLLYLRGMIRPTASGGTAGVFTREQAEQVYQEKGRISGVNYAESRIKHFTRGMVIGSKDYVNEVWSANRDLFGHNRRSGARKMQLPRQNQSPLSKQSDQKPTEPTPNREKIDWGDLRSLRDLRG